jgi:hypothetical protein
VSPNLCFLSYRPQILATCLSFNFVELCEVSVRLDNIDITHFIRVPPLMFFLSFNLPKIHREDPYKMSSINDVQSY